MAEGQGAFATPCHVGGLGLVSGRKATGIVDVPYLIMGSAGR